jgi:hypothetical protein
MGELSQMTPPDQLVTAADKLCPICARRALSIVLRSSIPTVCNLRLPDNDSVHAAETGWVTLASRCVCRPSVNCVFEASKVNYTQHYESSFEGSLHFAAFAENVPACLTTIQKPNRLRFQGQTVCSNTLQMKL